MHIHDTFLSLPLPPSLPPSPLPHIHQSCNPVVFAERIRMCPWQRMKEKSTGIKFQCNCLLNCGLQLLKFYPWFCVTTAVMNSVWLWFSHWRHAHSVLEKKMGWRWGLGAGVWSRGSRGEEQIWKGLKGLTLCDWGAGSTVTCPRPRTDLLTLLLWCLFQYSPINTLPNAINRCILFHCTHTTTKNHIWPVLFVCSSTNYAYIVLLYNLISVMGK